MYQVMVEQSGSEADMLYREIEKHKSQVMLNNTKIE